MPGPKHAKGTDGKPPWAAARFLVPAHFYTKKRKIIENQTNILSKNVEMLDNLSPLKILSRGYSVVKNEKSDIVTDSSNVNVGDNVEIILSNGAFKATVNEVTK